MNSRKWRARRDRRYSRRFSRRTPSMSAFAAALPCSSGARIGLFGVRASIAWLPRRAAISGRLISQGERDSPPADIHYRARQMPSDASSASEGAAARWPASSRHALPSPRQPPWREWHAMATPITRRHGVMPSAHHACAMSRLAKSIDYSPS